MVLFLGSNNWAKALNFQGPFLRSIFFVIEFDENLHEMVEFFLKSARPVRFTAQRSQSNLPALNLGNQLNIDVLVPKLKPHATRN